MKVKLDPKKSAIIVIDMQKGIATMERNLEPYSAHEVIVNVAKLVNRFRQLNATVFLVHVASHDGKDMLTPLLDQEPQWSIKDRPKDFAEFIDEIKPISSDIIITKKQWSAFYGTELDLQLRRREINTIVLCGISTNIGVETTAREAYQHGYNQVFAVDAMSAITKEEHDASQKFIFPKIGLMRTTEQVLDMLGK